MTVSIVSLVLFSRRSRTGRRMCVSLYPVAAGPGGVAVIMLLSIGQPVTVAGFAGVGVTTAIRMHSVILGWKLPAQRGVPTVTSVIRTIRNKPKRK